MTSPSTQPQITEQPLKYNPSQRTDKSHLQGLLEQVPKQQTEMKFSGDSPNISQTVFFQIMDQVDQYDHLLKQMNDLYTEGMLTIANLKFLNPYSSLSTKGYKPTPALIKVAITYDQQEKNIDSISGNQHLHLSLVTETKDINFTNSVIDSISKQHDRRRNDTNEENQAQSEAESRSAHSSESTANQLYTYQEEELIIEEQEKIDQCRKLMLSDKFSTKDFILDRFNIQSQQDIIIQGIGNFNALLQKLLQIADKKHHVNAKFNSIQTKKSKNSKNISHDSQ